MVSGSGHTEHSGYDILREVEATRRISEGATLDEVEQISRDEPAEAVPDADVEILDASPDATPSLPMHSVRGTAPGPRGCWAVKKDGQPCGAARRSDSDYCNAHAGHGVARDPAFYQPLATKARSENVRVRTEMRLALGTTRPGSPRAALRARANAHADKLAEAAVGGALKDGSLALRLIREVDPVVEVSVSAPVVPSTPEGVEALSYRELLAIAAAYGDRPSPDPEAAP